MHTIAKQIEPHTQIDENKKCFDNRALLVLTFPIITELLLVLLVGIADSFMASCAGEEAISLVDLLNNVFIQVFTALVAGGADCSLWYRAKWGEYGFAILRSHGVRFRPDWPVRGRPEHRMRPIIMLKKPAFLFTVVCLLALCGCSGTPNTLEESVGSQVSSGDGSSEPSPHSDPVPPDSTSPTTSPIEPSIAPELTDREKDWQEDLEYLRTQYKTLHPDPFRYVSEEEFDYQLEQLKRRISELSDTDIYFEVRKIVAGFCDVHTVAAGPDYLYERIFPFDVVCFGEKVYMYLYDEKYNELLEPYFLREIVAVNGIDISYIRQKASELLYPTNSWYNKEYLSYYFYLPALFDWVGCDHQEGYTFHILNEDNQVELVEIPIVPPEVDDITYDCYPDDFSIPESFRETDSNCAKYIDDERGGYIYLQFSYMKDGSMKPYEELLDTATSLLKEHPNCKLVVDLRKNSGGHSNAQLFTRQKISDWKTLPIEKTYILTGGFMVSAAIDLRTVFKEELGGITVGEPTGQFPATFGNSITPRQVVYLPNSQIPIYIADMWWSGMHPEDYLKNEHYIPFEWQNTVLPDVYVSMDVEDFRHGKDSVIEWIIEH